MKNYQKLKEIIQKANPEIMELKFGCEVEVKSKKADNFKLLVSEIVDENCFKCSQGIFWESIDYEIIGRPIRLSDVLMVINYRDFKVKNDWVYLGDAMQTRFWNLKDDNLDNQSEETKQFLISLLVKEQ